MIEITDAQFTDEVLKSEIPVLLDCWAPWCAPCKRLAPVLEELASEYSNRLKIVKINIDDNSEVVTQFGIRSVPYLIIFKNGQAISFVPGALPKPKLIEFIETHI